MHPIYRTGLGQSSHRFLPSDSSKPCMIGGIMFDPTAIETVAKELIGVNDCLVFKNTALPIDEQLSMFIVTDVIEQDREHLLFTIINNVSKFLNISQAPKTFYFIPSIPLNDNGKPWRSAAEKIAEKLEPIVITVDEIG